MLGVSVHMIRKWDRAGNVPVLTELAIIGLTILLEDDPEPTLNGTVAVHGAA
jgi:hypothetical protein